MLLIPSMMVSGGGNSNVQLSPGMIVFGGRGGRGNEGQSQIDGLGTGAAINGGGVSGYGQLETAQEVVMTTAGGLGEAEQGGPLVNFIPKSGRQQLSAPLLRLGHVELDAEQQLHAGA